MLDVTDAESLRRSDNSSSSASLTTEAILAERGKVYGDFTDHAAITQNLKRLMQTMPKWERLSDPHAEALEMIAHKIGRILNGDPNYRDSWDDIAGYAKLAADRCHG
jgi:hypothetical protein